MGAEIVIPVLLFVGLMVVGARVVAAMGVAGLAGLFLTVGWEPTLGTLEGILRGEATSLTLIAIPLFLLMAEFANESGIVARLFGVAQALLSRLRAGVAYATVIASAGMAALSGSSVAATGLLARIAVPEMTRLGYSPTLALGITATSGTIAVMIPPSVALILYGIITQNSIGALLIGGLVPGAATALGYLAVVGIWARVKPLDVPATERDERFSASTPPANAAPSALRRTSGAIIDVLPFVLIVLLVLIVIYTGAATVTEAAAIGAFSTLLAWVFLAVRRRRGASSPATATVAPAAKGVAGGSTDGPAGLTGADPGVSQTMRFSLAALMSAARKAVGTTVMILALVIMAKLLGAWLTRSGVTRDLTNWLAGLDLANIVLLLLISVVLIALGMFMSQIEILVLTLPLLYPLVTGPLGYDPIWFGIWMVKLLEIGLVSPPFGINVFVATAAAGPQYRVEQTFRGVLPFYAADALVLGSILLVPGAVTWAANVV